LKKKPDHILDIRGSIPPISLLKVSQAFRAMKKRETIEILCGDIDTRTDLFKVLPPLSYDLVLVEELEAEGILFRVRMKKKKNI
jgi:TusA-related sulfurtransferase